MPGGLAILASSSLYLVSYSPSTPENMQNENKTKIYRKRRWRRFENIYININFYISMHFINGFLFIYGKFL